MERDIRFVEELPQAWQEEPRPTLAMHPIKFALWLFIVSISMLFAAFSSAYMVRQAEGNWLEYDLPTIFWISSALLILSSMTMHWAYISAKRDNLMMLKIAMSVTVLLGISFMVTQWFSWVDMVDRQLFFAGVNPSASFLYVLTGVHVLHLITGLVFLLIVLVAAFRYRVHAKRLVQIEMCTTYWHFLDVLWLYLFAFLLFNH